MNILCIGAHPDDAEVFAGGTLALFARNGHNVLTVSLTNGDIGHHEMGGGLLARRRIEESQAAARIGGYESVTLDNHDGELTPDLHLRKDVTRIIRNHKADIVFTHRPNDYHPDHRYASQVVQDAAFMVTVPQFCSNTPALRKNPLFLYLFDPFTFPAPFRADVVVPIDEVMDIKWQLLNVMPSQFYEWLPWLDGVLGEVPPESDKAARFAWLRQQYRPQLTMPTRHSPDKCGGAEFVEMFQVCEYGTQPEPDVLKRMFRFTGA